MGFQVALKFLVSSRWKGQCYDNMQQFDTIRTIQTLYSHLFESSNYTCNDIGLFRGSKGESYVVPKFPTQLLFFVRFARGCLGRMGREIKSDLVLDPRIVHVILNSMEAESIRQSSGWERKRWLTMVGTYLMVGVSCSLREMKFYFWRPYDYLITLRMEHIMMIRLIII